MLQDSVDTVVLQEHQELMVLQEHQEPADSVDTVALLGSVDIAEQVVLQALQDSAATAESVAHQAHQAHQVPVE